MKKILLFNVFIFLLCSCVTKRNSMKDLNELYSSEDFKLGKIYFQYGNYPYLFKFADGSEIIASCEMNNTESLIAICLSHGLDDLYYLVYNTDKKGYYLKNGKAIEDKDERLKYPIRMANSLNELFGTKNIETKLIFLKNEEFDYLSEKVYNEYEESIKDNLPSFFIPNQDLRIFFKQNCNTCFFSDHKEINIQRLYDFSKRTSLMTIKEIDDFVMFCPNYKSYMEIVSKANREIGRAKFLYVYFYPSAYHGIINIEDISRETLISLLKYGLIYNKLDIDDKIYQMLD